MLFLCISSVSALENQTDDSGENGKISISESPENQTDDSGENGKIGISESPKISNATNGTYTDLAARIADAIANNGSVLYLPYNFAYNAETDYKYNHFVYPDYPYYGILINETLTINGNNHTISGSNVARIFTINATGGVVTFNNITFVDSAGAINFETDLNVNDCTFINNNVIYSIGSWSAINGCGGDLTVTNSTFVNNTALKGGAIYLMQTAITTITGSVFTKNTATGNEDLNAGAGAIYANGGLKLNIDNCTFNDNMAIVGNDTSWAGAIEAFYDTVISNSKFNNNSAGYGGAVNVVGGSVDPDTIVISNTTFTNNVASEYGGAIYNLEANVTIQSCIFDGNKAYDGSTIFNDGESLLYLCNNNITSTKAEIYNKGDIISTSYVTVLENKTVKAEYGQTVTLNATHIDDNGNLIYDTDFNFTVYGVDDPIPSTYADGIYTATYKVDKIEEKAVSVSLNYVTIYEGLLNISPSNVTTVIFAPSLTKYYKGSEKFTATVTGGKGQATPNKTVNITLNGVTYSRTTGEDGTVKLNINLNSGEYPVIVAADDVTVNSTITVKETIVGAMDLVKVYGDDNTFNVEFIDANGNELETTTVFFNVNGVIYNRTTGFEGDVEMDINLHPGEYIITSINPVTGEMKSNTIKVISTIESSDLTKYYKNDSQFVVRLLNDDGSYALEGQEVKFNINGIFYTRTTNATGHAKLNINLAQGNYIVTTYYKNCSQGNNIEVLPILGADDLDMKYMDGSQFKAKLVDGQGNPYPNQNVTFNINGVFYNRTTDSAGVAKLNIRLMPGEYIITSSYNGCNIANKITVKS